MLKPLLSARAGFLFALVPLTRYETGPGQARIGEAFALTGYLELLLAEDYCPGVAFSQPVFGGGITYGGPLTTDSLLRVAQAHFDSALVYGAKNGEGLSGDTITDLASVGLGRALLDRGQYDSAAAVVANVPTAFVYAVLGMSSGNVNEGSGAVYPYQPTFYEDALNQFQAFGGQQGSDWDIADQKGGNGLAFVSAADPRLVVNTTLEETGDGLSGLPDSVLHYPMRFGNPNGSIPLASGVEARLIEAEDQLSGSTGSAITWLQDLNTLRYGTCTGPTNASCTLGAAAVPGQVSGLLPLVDPGASTPDTLRARLTFQERAFWLFGSGTRLGDLRRMVRQYGWQSNQVYPSGTYEPSETPAIVATWEGYGLPLPQHYGTDVDITLPTPQGEAGGFPISNPNYKGCLAATTVA